MYTKRQLQKFGLSTKEIAAATHEGLLEARDGLYYPTQEVFDVIKEAATLRIVSNETGYSYNLVCMVDEYFASTSPDRCAALIEGILENKCRKARAHFLESEGFDWGGFDELDLRKE